MNPTETVLLAFVVALALVGVGYWMGRTLPALRPGRSQPFNSTMPAPRRPEPTRRTTGVHLNLGSSDRLKHDIDAQRQVMRRAREFAEPWQPPAVDQVTYRASESAYAAWFADTTVEPAAPKHRH